ncbi:Ribosome quality control complex subunit 2 [Cyberlindnera fabianii]|uniref:Ribosome quality control complex subunit 2 n=1 Tax=Cyberlindnera fabianii TaxID=36022 RepID=A0A1V2LE57_CYBFA|nr:Ribosome quality control complex subunit 2 [Cyberlindnera fabianii]
MKQRVTALDLQILTKELQDELIDYRLSNIYNITTSNRQYLLKFAVPDSKKNLVLDSGFKAHITDFTRPTPQTPTSFVTKLRKHLKTRRLSSIKQIGIDRAVVLTFSDGAFHLVLEFFSAGNIVLLDDQRRIMALQRLVEEKGSNDRYAVGETYNLFDDTLFDESDEIPEEKTYTADDVKQWITEKKSQALETIASSTGKKSKAKLLSIQKAVYQKVPYLSAELLAKMLDMHGVNPSASSVDYEDNAEPVAAAIADAQKEFENLIHSDKVTGYILTKPNPLYDPSKDEEDLKLLYDQFHPFAPLLKPDESLIEVEGYNKTIDKFFSTIESSKYALRIQNQENQAKTKIEKARNEKHLQVQRLIDVQEVNKLKGETIIFNAHHVESAKAAVQALLDQSMDWKTIEKLIKLEQSKGNEVAKLINLPLNLKQNKISLNLLTEEAYEDEEEQSESSDSDSSSDSDDSDDEASFPKQKKKQEKVKNSINVTIDLGLSAYANASEYFTVKKNTVEKQKKVEQSATKALKNIEHKIEKDLKKNLKQETEVLRKLRNPYFFEKFNWFISNENYLILSGKDDSQTDMIYHRYVTPDDIYVSADVDGASHVFIKNPNKGEVSPSTLTQAGIMALATSKAWENKMVTSPWWCYASDMTKSDIDGKILKAGTFRFFKEKNFLPPAQMVMGFGFLWKIKTEKNQKELEQQLEDLENLDINDIDGAENAEDDTEKDAEPESAEPANVSEAKEETTPETAPAEKSEEPEAPAEVDETTPQGDDDDNTDTMSTFSKATDSAKQVRGKKGKKKKAQKYADQDEEERRLRMEALGTLKQQAKKEDDMKKQQIQKINHLKKIERKKRQEEMTANKYAGKKEVIDYEEILNELTPTITKEDEVLEAIPVFAPWNALNKCRYRVKVQPGNTKKGKALQEMMHYFSIRPTDATEHDRTFDWPREHEILKGIKDTEMLPAIYVGKLKVLLPGKAAAPKRVQARGSKKK